MRNKQEVGTGVKLERPNFGDNQVKNVSEIKWRNKYIEHYHGGISVITLMSRKGDTQWIRIMKESGYVGDHSLADLGVISYETGLWNKTNWLERMEG